MINSLSSAQLPLLARCVRKGKAPLVKPPKTPDAPGGPDKKLPEAEGRQPISESRQLLKKAVQVLEEAEKHKER